MNTQTSLPDRTFAVTPALGPVPAIYVPLRPRSGRQAFGRALRRHLGGH